MKANKTQPSPKSVEVFLAEIDDELRRNDAKTLAVLMADVTKTKPVMWGSSIIGFGTYHYVYKTGREGDTMSVGFAPRKNALAIYGLFEYERNEENIELAKQLGPHTHGKGCLYIKDLSKIDPDVLKKIIAGAYKIRNNLKLS